ncbi:unnamed protein product, partial [Mesorhabditis belari]|uniref:C2H2-type domain-containing protein n=1 Tax=Mesorhabditis belari TaxID=2138241 RepID=A0AAF3F5F2_9BILA
MDTNAFASVASISPMRIPPIKLSRLDQRGNRSITDSPTNQQQESSRVRRKSAIKAVSVIKKAQQGKSLSDDDEEEIGKKMEKTIDGDLSICQKCQQNVAERDQEIHSKSHFIRYQCSMCVYSSYHKKGMRAHIWQRHGNENIQCYKEEASKDSLDELLQQCFESKKLKSQTKEFETVEVSKVSITKTPLTSRPKLCTYKLLSRSIEGHVYWHCGDKYGSPYQCSLCDYKSNQTGAISTHLRKKHNGKGERVEIACDQLFAQSVHLSIACFPQFADAFENCKGVIESIEKKYNMEPFSKPFASEIPSKKDIPEANLPLKKRATEVVRVVPEILRSTLLTETRGEPPSQPLVLPLPSAPMKWLRDRLETGINWNGWNDKHKCLMCAHFVPAGHIQNHVQLHKKPLRYRCSSDHCAFQTESFEKATAHGITNIGHQCEDQLDAMLFTSWVGLIPHCFPAFMDVFPRSAFDWATLNKELERREEEIREENFEKNDILEDQGPLTPKDDQSFEANPSTTSYLHFPQQQPFPIAFNEMKASQFVHRNYAPLRRDWEKSRYCKAERCQLCNEEVYLLGDFVGSLIMHVKIHSSRPNFQCSNCLRFGYTVNDIDEHGKLAHSGQEFRTIDVKDERLEFEWFLLANNCFPKYSKKFMQTEIFSTTNWIVRKLSSTEMQNARKNRELARIAGTNNNFSSTQSKQEPISDTISKIIAKATAMPNHFYENEVRPLSAPQIAESITNQPTSHPATTSLYYLQL